MLQIGQTLLPGISHSHLNRAEAISPTRMVRLHSERGNPHLQFCDCVSKWMDPQQIFTRRR